MTRSMAGRVCVPIPSTQPQPPSYVDSWDMREGYLTLMRGTGMSSLNYAVFHFQKC